MNPTDATTGRVIIADDEVHITFLVADKLRQAGLDVREFHNGYEARAAALVDPPDVIVTDYQMPILDGFEMAKALFAEPATASVPVIMLTARGHKVPPQELEQTHIVRLMQKPFSAKELLAAVQDVLLSGSGRIDSEAA